MALPDETSTDATSIKPVSSLRSHFENLISPIPSPLLAFQRPALTMQNEPDRGRSSLDSPRQPSQWTASTESQRRQISRSPEKPRYRSLEPGAAPRQRPVSMGPWSPPRTPPTVMVQSPRSPTKPDIPSSAVIPSPRTLTPVNTNPRPRPTPPPVPQSRPNIGVRRLGDSGQPQAPKLEITALSKLPSFVLNKSSPGPPPVNRADKPQIPSKPSTPTLAAWNKLEPGRNIASDKISPFSTPPSSDDGAEQNSARPYQESIPSHVSIPDSSKAYIPSLTGHQNRETWRGASGGPSKQVSLKEYIRPEAVKHQDSFSVVEPKLPPSLPARPNLRSVSSADPSLGGLKSIAHSSSRSPAPLLPARPSEASKGSRTTREIPQPPPKTNARIDAAAIPKSDNFNSRQLSIPSRASTQRYQEPPQSETAIVGFDAYSNPNTGSSNSMGSSEYPNAFRANRRPPRTKAGISQIDTKYDTRLFDISARYVCTTGYLTRAWDIKTGSLVLDMDHGENKEFKITAMAFKPAASVEEEGFRLWLGSNCGDIQEIDLLHRSLVQTRPSAHSKREVVKIYRHQKSMWSLDDDGKLYAWLPDEDGLPNLQSSPKSYRVLKGHSFSIVVQDYLWVASGKEIRIYNLGATADASFYVIQQALCQPGAGEITSGTVISDQLRYVYFGHSDGKVTIYSATAFTCLGIVNVSSYKINTLAGCGSYLWAGYNTGMIYVYDTRPKPWTVKKDWQAHEHLVSSILVDRSSVWKFGHLQVASIGIDNAIRMWDGMLEEDWLENDMQDHEAEYCNFRVITTVVATWNAGASTPGSLRRDQDNDKFFLDVIQSHKPPDILVFGFQELVDLEDKKLTAKILLKGSKKNDSSESEHMSRQYRAWRDYLVRLLMDNMPSEEPYYLLRAAPMVGLFSCVFIKASQRGLVRNLHVAEIKRGLGGHHGNKGALILRFTLDDSSLCFTNCHLAAGQTQTVSRNVDIAAILEAAALPIERDPVARANNYICGGDGSMIMDHEICVINGDLNYRIDTMGRDTVIKAVKTNNLAKLLERDQLLVSRRRNPGFRLRSFIEAPITFPPTYKYDVGTDNYDSSEKNRSPAWCDRLLYRGGDKVTQLDYRRHELRTSDHRPVSGTFEMRIKSVSPSRRDIVLKQCETRLTAVREQLFRVANIDYLVNVLGVNAEEARHLVSR